MQPPPLAKILEYSLPIIAVSLWAAEAPAAEGAPAPHQASAIVAAVFDRLDCDYDGTIDIGEIDEHFAMIWLPADGDRSRGLSRREYSAMHGALSVADEAALFRDADADGSGQVTAWELRLHLQRLVEMLDDDGDYEISRADTGMGPSNVAPPKASRDGAASERT
jgi:hypothetical protein